MEVFGVGPFELLFLLVLSVIVLGPERLQQVAHGTGRLIARVLAWQHQSPEAQMIQQIRRDFETEIVALRNELLQARQHLDISSDVRHVYQEVRSAATTPALTPDPASVATGRPRKYTPSAAPPPEVETSTTTPHDVPSIASPSPSRAPPISATSAHPSDSAPLSDERLLHQLLHTPPDETTRTHISDEALVHRLASLQHDVDSLYAHIRARGLSMPDTVDMSAGSPSSNGSHHRNGHRPHHNHH